jgi:hypothetical protein
VTGPVALVLEAAVGTAVRGLLDGAALGPSLSAALAVAVNLGTALALDSPAPQESPEQLLDRVIAERVPLQWSTDRF